MKFILNILKNRLFILFLVLSTSLWYVNKLGHVYKTEVEIPIQLLYDINSVGWIENPTMRIKCLVEGNGNDLLRYNIGLAPTLNIPTTSLYMNELTKANYYAISEMSLREAVSIAQSNFQVIQIIDTLPWIKVTPIESAMLPIKSNIDINCQKQYMIVGQPKLQPDQIKIRAPKSILDTLQYIETEKIMFRDLDRPLSKNTALILPPGVIAAENSVRFSVDITSYTELEYRIAIEVINAPDNRKTVCVPSHVRVLVRVPIRSLASELIELPRATVDFLDIAQNPRPLLLISTSNLPQGGTVSSLIPEFAELFSQAK